MRVYVFHGHGSQYGNAVFSSVSAANAWISKHKLTGMLTGYDLDDPAFDVRLKNKSFHKFFRDILRQVHHVRDFIERYTDGEEHYHYILGVSDEDPGFDEACKRWEQKHNP